MIILCLFCRRYVLELTDGIDNTGGVKWQLAMTLLAAWVLVYFCIRASHPAYSFLYRDAHTAHNLRVVSSLSLSSCQLFELRLRNLSSVFVPFNWEFKAIFQRWLFNINTGNGCVMKTYAHLLCAVTARQFYRQS